MLRLRTLGGFGVTDASGAPASLPPHRLALLALLAAAGDRGMGRDKVLAYLWPESTPTKARASLEQMLHALRVSLDDRSILLGNPLRLDEAVVSSDVGDFHNALAAGTLERAASLYEGPFLDGFYLSEVPEFEQWVTTERSRLEAQYVDAAEKLAAQAAAGGDHAKAIRWIRALGAVTLPSATSARRFMEMLAAAGDRDAAVEFAVLYNARVRAELGSAADASTIRPPEKLREDDSVRSGDRIPVDVIVAPTDQQSSNVVRPAPRMARRRLAVAALISVAALVGAWSWLTRAKGPVLDPNVIAVMPFRITAPDSSYNYLREGMIDLLNARLTGDGIPRGLESRTLLMAWRRAVGAGNELAEGQAQALARRLGASQLLTGSLVITPRTKVLTASLRDVATGRVLLSHRDDKAGDELRLGDRLTHALLARTIAPAAPPRQALSDSLEAVKEYLAGLRAGRANEWKTAGLHYTRALNIDSSFALAALKQWEAVGQGSAFPRPGGPPFTDADWGIAWRLRDRLSPRDELRLKAQGTYYLYSDVASAAPVTQAAAHAAPDDAKSWTIWGRSLTYLGSLHGVAHWAERAATVLDSAIALDSTNAEPVRDRLLVALSDQNAIHVGRYLGLLERLGSTGDDMDAWRWAAATMTRDPKALAVIRSRLTELSGLAVFSMAQVAFFAGLPLDDVQLALETRRRHAVTSTQFSGGTTRWLFHVLAARGRRRDALSLADSVVQAPDTSRMSFAEHITRQALIEPGAGYEQAAQAAAPALSSLVKNLRSSYQVAERSALCLTTVFQVLQTDTSHARAVINKLHEIADKSPILAVRATRGGSCPALLAALMDRAQNSQEASRSLQRLDSLLKRGLYWDRVAPTATIILARMHESQGSYAAALDMAQRRSRFMADYHVGIWPAVLRLEGRLAATVGDTTAAIRAYRHYLALRDQPNPGPMANEVAEVRAHLAKLDRARVR